MGGFRGVAFLVQRLNSEVNAASSRRTVSTASFSDGPLGEASVEWESTASFVKQRFEVGFLHAICIDQFTKVEQAQGAGPVGYCGGRERAAGAGRRMNLDAKREVAMAAKEEARRQRNARIAADKNAKSEARKQADSQARAEAEAQAEQTRKLMARREQNHARRAAARGHPDAIAGYCKADIVALKAAFDDFDRAVFGLDELTGLVDLE